MTVIIKRVTSVLSYPLSSAFSNFPSRSPVSPTFFAISLSLARVRNRKRSDRADELIPGDGGFVSRVSHAACTHEAPRVSRVSRERPGGRERERVVGGPASGARDGSN